MPEAWIVVEALTRHRTMANGTSGPIAQPAALLWQGLELKNFGLQLRLAAGLAVEQHAKTPPVDCTLDGARRRGLCLLLQPVHQL